MAKRGSKEKYLGTSPPQKKIEALKAPSGERRVGRVMGKVSSPSELWNLWRFVASMSSFSAVRDGTPTENAFWCILNSTERSFLHLHGDALSPSDNVSCHIWGARTRFWGQLPPPQRRTATGRWRHFGHPRNFLPSSERKIKRLGTINLTPKAAFPRHDVSNDTYLNCGCISVTAAEISPRQKIDEKQYYKNDKNMQISCFCSSADNNFLDRKRLLQYLEVIKRIHKNLH